MWRSIALIVVLTGTNPYSFDRLVKPLDDLTKERGWDVFVQLGNTKYIPNSCKYERFIEKNKLLAMIKDSELVITQGGYGGIRDALLYNKPVVAVPRYPNYIESTDYQEEIVKAMEEMGYLIGVYDIRDLEDAIEKARNFVPAPKKNCLIPEMIHEYIQSLQI